MVGVGVCAAHPALAQQVLEIDLGVGRTVIDDPWRSMSSRVLALDEPRSVLYVNDAEEPEGIMVFSLETGEWLRTIAVPEGEGPREIPGGHRWMDVGKDGQLYVFGLTKVIEFDAVGAAVNSWLPTAPSSLRGCAFGDGAAIPTQRGVIRMSADGYDGIGPDVVNSHVLSVSGVDEAWALTDLIRKAKIGCTTEAAYVAMAYPPPNPDTVFVYTMAGVEGRLSVPTEFTEDADKCIRRQHIAGRLIAEGPCPTWNHGLYPSVDGHGDIVLMGYHKEIAGAVIDPDTGCYAILRKPERDATLSVARVYADSVLVFTRDTTTRDLDGREATVLYRSNRVSIHPLRRVSGEPCPGMLPSVEVNG